MKRCTLIVATVLLSLGAIAGESAQYTFKRVTNPDGTLVLDGRGEAVAEFTDGCRTVRLNRSERTFAERSAANPVVTRDWVRVLPETQPRYGP